MAKLVVREGRNVDWEYVFPADKRRVVFGRRSANEVPVADPKASRNHAEIIVEGGRYVLRDLKSRNGTLLNYRPVKADEELEFGDRIRIGDAVFELIDETKDEPITIEIPGYDILERIGRGGMGTVYRARQVSMDRVVALKVLNDTYSKDQQFIERFIREARAAGRLSHPNVIHVHDVSESNGIHYFSMEYVDGTTVKRLMKRQGRIEVDKALDIALQAAKALEYAHENEIVHRDIKPDNLMLTRDGVVKLADLGIAKTFQESAEGGQARRVYGTPHYMAPEQALGKEIDARADIYGLGATFYHMLTGATPFQGNTVTDILKAHIQSTLPPIQEKTPDVPDSVVAVVERMMAKSADKRYPEMAALIEDLEKVTGDREAKIEGVGAGESSIAPAVPAEIAKKRRRERAEKPKPTPAWKKAVIGTAGAVGLVGLFVGTFLAANTLLSPEPSAREMLELAQEASHAGRTDEARGLIDRILTKHDGTPEADMARALLADMGGTGDDEFARELARAKGLEESSGPEAALAAAEALLERDPPGQVAAQARALVERLETAIAEKAETEAADALAAALKWGQDNPNDLRGRLERLGNVARAYPDVPSGRAAARRADVLERRMTREGERQAERDFNEAQSRARDAHFRGDFDAAIREYDTFLARHGRSAVASEARRGKRALEQEIESAFRETKAAAERQLKAGQFGQALARVDRFLKKYVSQKWGPQARKLMTDMEADIEGAFQKESAKARKAALSFAYNDAAGQYNLLANRFRGTRWSDFSLSRIKQVREEGKLYQELVRRVNAEGRGASHRELPFLPPGVPDTMKDKKWYVLAASDQGLTLYPEERKQFQRPVKWSALPAERLLDVFELYLPKPKAAEHLAMAYLCEERGLGERAQTHYQAAAVSGGN